MPSSPKWNNLNQTLEVSVFYFALLLAFVANVTSFVFKSELLMGLEISGLSANPFPFFFVSSIFFFVNLLKSNVVQFFTSMSDIVAS